MNKDNILIIIFLILIVVIGAFVFSNTDNNSTNNTAIENVMNVVNNIEEKKENIIENTNIVTNEISNTLVTNETNTNKTESVVQDNIISSPEKNAYESNSNVGSTDQKQQAINLVKEYWGEDSSVKFSCDSVTANGEYIIAVTSKDTASVKGYFRVNINTKKVEVDY